MRTCPLKLPSLLLLTVGLIQFNGAAQNTNMPYDVGTVVSGFQDNFTNITRDPAWVAVGAGGDQYFQTNGVLSIGTMYAGNPNHLLYVPAGSYDGTTQEVLIRIRILNMPFVPQGSAHAGALVVAEPPGGEALPAGSGVNWQLMNTSDNGSLFGDDIDGPQARSLYDYVAWGPGYTNDDIPWQTYTWYWMRLHLDGLSTQGNTYSNMWGKVWLGDGSQAEPTNWQYMDAYDLTASTGTGVTNGVAGIGAGTSGAGDDFEVDYFLLKATNLPSITVNPILDPLYLNEQPVDITSAVGSTASFSVTSVSTGSAPTYQWQSAAAGTSNFNNISGANASTYTTPTLGSGDNGSSYRVVVTIASPSTQVISTNAVLTLGSAPTLVYAKTLGQPNQVTLLFSEPVSVPSGVSGFAINNGASVTGVAQGGNTSTLVLTTTGLTLGGSYIITINGVQSTAGAPLAAGTQAVIDFTVEVPAEFGQVVTGFQEDFNEATLSTNWIAVPLNDNPFTQSGGMLHMNSITNITTNNPVHLFYEPSNSYSSDAQEVLMRMRITLPPYADAFVLGTSGSSVAGDPVNGGHAANLLMLDPSDPDVFGLAGPQAQILVDYVAWGGIIDLPGTTNAFVWQPNTWYWLRLMMTTASPATGSNNLFAKIWLGDGSTPEPPEWQSSLSLTLSTGDPLFAGVVAPSDGYPESYDVDYFLLETPDLPSITVSPDAFQVADTIYLSITNQPVSEFVPGGQNATFTANAIGSAPVTIQWQVAASNSTTFVNISGATNNSLTVSNVLGPQNGNQYEAVFTLSGGAIVKTSVVAVVSTDVTPPALVFARTGGSNGQVIVEFSKPIPTPDATNFSINNGVAISGLVAGPTSNEVILAVSPLSLGSNYTLTATDISDYSGNVLISGQIQIDFTVYLPAEFGTTVVGFQDDFTEATMNTNWVIYSADGGGSLNVPVPSDLTTLDFQSNGNLYIGAPPSGDNYNPVHLVYAPPTPYNSTNQEVLARIMVTSFLPSGQALAGVSVCTQTNNARGISWLLTDNSVSGTDPLEGPNTTLLNDYVAWGPNTNYVWALNTWYWMRLSQVASSTPGTATAYGKVWVADGATPEPAAWQESWAYTTGGNLERGADDQGYAGFDTASSGGFCSFQVSYVLIEAAGLSNVLVSAGSLFPFSSTTLSFTQTSPGSLSLQWTGSGTLQTASAVNGPWTDVGGATSPYNVNTTLGVAAFFRVKE
jgi:hypothetical protein